MKSVLLLVAVLVGCDDPENNSLEVTINAGSSEQTGGVIIYQGNGTFTVTVTATTGEDDQDHKLQALAAELLVVGDGAPPTAVTKATLSRVEDHVYRGNATLAWVPGGVVNVIARVAGIEKKQQLTIRKPRIALQVGSLSPSTGTATTDVPFCIVSTARGVSVSIHIDGATFSSSTDTDKTVPLLRGPCTLDPATITVPPPTDLVVESHATLSLTTSTPNVAVSAVLASPIVGAPPLDVIQTLSPGTITVPPKVDSVVFVTPPASGHAGDVVTLTVKVTDAAGNPIKGVTEAFTSSDPDVVFLPATAKSNGAGLAQTSFVMPSAGETLIVSATGAAPLAIAIAP